MSSNLSEEEIMEYLKNKHIYFSEYEAIEDYETEEMIQGLLDLYNKEKEKNKRLENAIENREFTWKQKYGEIVDFMKEDTISKDKIKEILGIEDNVSNEAILSLIQTILDENNRLEDIEDKKVQIEYNNVFNKGVKSVEDKIKEKIEELNNKPQYAECIEGNENDIRLLQELLKGE